MVEILSQVERFFMQKKKCGSFAVLRSQQEQDRESFLGPAVPSRAVVMRNRAFPIGGYVSWALGT